MSHAREQDTKSRSRNPSSSSSSTSSISTSSSSTSSSSSSSSSSSNTESASGPVSCGRSPAVVETMSRSSSHSPDRDGVNRERHRSRRARSRYRSRSWERGHGYRHTLNPEPNKCLGIFGLHEYTTERRLHDIFGKYGSIDKIIIIVDAKSGRSRGFGFAYFKNQDDAKTAKAECSGLEIDGRKIRVDFSITQRPHNPTPGVYMGRPLMRDNRSFRWRSYDRYDNGRYDNGRYDNGRYDNGCYDNGRYDNDRYDRGGYYDRYGGGRDYDDYYDGGYTSGRRGYYKERRSPSYSKYRSRDDRSRSRSNFPRYTKPK